MLLRLKREDLLFPQLQWNGFYYKLLIPEDWAVQHDAKLKIL